MHIKQVVSLQQHLEILPESGVFLLKPGAGEGCCCCLTLFLAKAGLGTARCMHDKEGEQGSAALAKRGVNA